MEETTEKEIPVSREEFERVAQQVQEIHAFVSGVAEALNNPMLKAMMPAHMRGMLGG